MSFAASVQPSAPPPPPVPPVPPPPVPPVPPPPVPPVPPPPVPPVPPPPWVGFEAPQPTAKHNKRRLRCRMRRTLPKRSDAGVGNITKQACDRCRSGSILRLEAEPLQQPLRPGDSPMRARPSQHAALVV